MEATSNPADGDSLPLLHGGAAELEMTPFRAGLRRTVDLLHETAKLAAVLAIVGELVIVLAEVVGRAVFAHSFLWADEAAKLALCVIAFVGGAVAYRDGRHTTVDMLVGQLPRGGRRMVLAATEWIVVLVGLVGVLFSRELFGVYRTDLTPMMQMSVSFYFVPLIVGLALISVYGLERLVLRHAPATAAATGAVLVLAAVAFEHAAPMALFMKNPGLSLGCMIALFFAAVLMGLPVSFAMLLSTLLYLRATDTAPPAIVLQNMVDGTSNFILLALPFFLFAGVIMERGGISVRLVNFALTLVGWLRGGLLQVMVVTIYLVSGISGSKIADVAAVGSVMRDELRKQRYSAAEGAAVLAASAAMAETIPPSIAMLVLGSVTSVSIGTLFVAGLLPAAVIAACLMLLIYVRCWNRKDGDSAGRGVPVKDALVGAILPTIMPVAMIVGIRFGVATPTEVSAFAVVYGIVLATLVYRETSLRSLMGHVGACAAMAGVVLFVIASAGSFAWVLSAANLPQQLVALLHGSSPTMFMLGTVALLIVVGSLLEGLPAIIILAPLLMPIAVGAGFDPVHYAIVLILAMGIGAFMPPIGIGFYVAVAVARSSLETSARAMLPYLAVLVLAVILIALVPGITLSVPKMLGH